MNNGKIIATASAGTPPFSFFLNGTAKPNGNFLNLPAASYEVKITDSKSCIDRDTIVLTPATQIAISPVVQNVLCFGESNGAITTTITGGTAPYSKLWSTNATTNVISNLQVGDYTISVTDNNGCLQNKVITVTQPDLLEIEAEVANIQCIGDDYGSIVVSPQGGTLPYSYQWENGSTSNIRENLSVGEYSVTVTDLNGCEDDDAYSINVPRFPLTLSWIKKQNVLCNGDSTGAINLKVNGGVHPYSFIWSNGATTEDLDNLPAGTYSVTILDYFGCTIDTSIVITQPQEPLSLTSSITNNICFGDKSGSINIEVAGGVPNYSYNWSNSLETQDIENLFGGIYFVEVEDENACLLRDTFEVFSPETPIEINFLVEDILCYGRNTGKITAQISGGYEPYSILWNNGVNDSIIENLAEGWYSVSVTDSLGCMVVDSAFVANQLYPLNVSSKIISQPTCYNQLNGSVNITLNGGLPPFTFLWSNGETTEDLDSLSAGNYSVIITDSNNCMVGVTANVIQPDSLALSFQVTNVACYQNNTGAIALTVSGGNGGNYINWSNGKHSQTITQLTAGKYVADVTDSKGCFVTDTVYVTQPDTTLTVTPIVNNVNCFNGNDGNITLSAEGGIAPYNALWSTGATGLSINNLPAGAYSTVLTDAAGCSIPLSFEISVPLFPLRINEFSFEPVFCKNGNNGMIIAQVGGGTSPYYYNWTNGDTTPTADSLNAGQHNLTITDSNGCELDTTFILNEPPTSIEYVFDITHTTCDGDLGSIDLWVFGGIAPYQFLWSTGEVTQNVANLTAGDYTVFITDANNCVVEAVATVMDGIQVYPAITNVSCFGLSNGAIDITLQNGVPPYSILWNNGATTQDINNLAAGEYTIYVEDTQDCSTEVKFTVQQPAFEVNTDFHFTNVLCYGGNNAAIQLLTGGGTPPYTYNWSNGENTQNLNNLTAGTYNVEIIDANNCATDTFVVISQPEAPLTVTFQKNDILCNNAATGAIETTVSGGTPDYLFYWSNGSNSQNPTNLTAGKYIVTIFDDNLCSVTDSIEISQPENAVTFTHEITHLNCFEVPTGKVDISPAGGVLPYAYLWSNGWQGEDLLSASAGDYSVTVTDFNGCEAYNTFHLLQPTAVVIEETVQNVNCFGEETGAIAVQIKGGTPNYTILWENGSNQTERDNLPAAEYQITVTDSKACQTIKTIAVSQPEMPINLTIEKTDVNCFGGNDGTINLIVTGGTQNYSYQWSNGFHSEDLTGLLPGTYFVTVTDALNCVSQISTQIAQPQAPLTVTLTPNNILCNGASTGSIDIAVSGGTPEYIFEWSNGSASENLVQLIAGRYSVIVTDHNNCVSSASTTISEPLSINTSFSIENNQCFGLLEGEIIMTVSGGVNPYYYSWSNGATTKDLLNLASGTYYITITDNNNCTFIDSAKVLQPDEIIIQPEVNHIQCFGMNNGNIVLNVSGGTPAYNFHWSNGVFTQNISELQAGNYTVTITDENLCQTVGEYQIMEPTIIELGIEKTDVFCYGSATGTILLSAEGGVPPYNYNWSNGETSQNLKNIKAGWYSVAVRDTNNCLKTKSVLIEEPEELKTSIETTFGCEGSETGHINLTPYGGMPPFSFLWQNGETTEDLHNISTGNYSVTITDNNYCSTTEDIELSGNEQITVQAEIIPSDCDIVANGAIYLSINGGQPPYSFAWQNSTAVSQQITNLTSGEYSVLITDLNNCSFTETYFVELLNNECIEIANAFTPNGDGNNDTWIIENINLFPEAEINIYDRYGKLVFKANSADAPWDGTYYNQPLPVDTYYYIINFYNNLLNPIQGNVTIVR